MTTDTAPSRPIHSGALASLLSEDVGIVHRLDDGVTHWDHPRLAPAFAHVCDTAPLLDLSLVARSGGMAIDPPAARLSALGEAVERYSASYAPASRLRLAHRRELRGPVAEPDWLDRHGERPATHWVPGHLLSSIGAGTPGWVAASRTYLASVDHDAPVMHPTSTGLACHPDPWTALASGLLEVVERDAIMLTWLPRVAPVPIETALRWRTAQGVDVRFDRAVERYRLFLLPSPTGIPVVLGVALGADGQPAVAVGAGAHLDLVQACRRALIETHQTFQWAEYMQAQGRGTPSTPDECRDFNDHVAYYLRPDRLDAFDFLLGSREGPICVDLDDLDILPAGEDLARGVTQWLADVGFDAFAVDVTAPDIRTAGLWVVRSVVPGMYPLVVGTSVRPDLDRLPADRPVNPDPHPFP